MILTDIRNYLRDRKHATLADIALHVEADPDAVRGMLQRLLAKGQVTRNNVSSSCGTSCSKCDPAARELYFWVDRDAGG